MIESLFLVGGRMEGGETVWPTKIKGLFDKVF